jgi:hypothetical protein
LGFKGSFQEIGRIWTSRSGGPCWRKVWLCNVRHWLPSLCSQCGNFGMSAMLGSSAISNPLFCNCRQNQGWSPLIGACGG